MDIHGQDLHNPDECDSYRANEKAEGHSVRDAEARYASKAHVVVFVVGVVQT